MVEVGNFVEYQGYLIAVVAINEKKKKAYGLCYENHLLATFPLDDKGIEVVKQDGCPKLVKHIYDLMKYHKEGFDGQT